MPEEIIHEIEGGGGGGGGGGGESVISVFNCK